jgi:hypothetical protein
LARKKKHVLSLEIEIDFAVIGLSSHQKDFKLSWSINKHLHWQLKKEDDVLVELKSSTAKVPFTLFSFVNNELGCEFLMLENKHQGYQLLPEVKGADYLIIVRGAYSKELLTETIEKLKQNSLINTAFEVDENKIVNKQNLYFLL